MKNKHTQPLTAEEKELIPIIIKLIQTHKHITNKIIIKCIKALINMNEYPDISLTEGRIRKIINHIRVNKLCKNLIASGKGYYIAKDNKEVQDYVGRLWHRIHEQIKVVRSYGLVDDAGQIKLF